MLRRIVEFKREGIIGQLKNLHNEELYKLCSSLNIIRIIQLGWMRWVGHKHV
jgi:hypothetical protein